MITGKIIDTGLEQHIREFAAATGREIRDVARDALKSLVRYALQFTPPGSAKVQGLAAKRAGETTILRDLGRMGFTPVPIKGFRLITQVYGRPLKKPIRVATKINPKFANPEEFHRQRLIAAKGRGGHISRGGQQAFYVDRRKFEPLRKKWLGEVGRLASWAALAARELGLAVPAWIARHLGQVRGTGVRTHIDGARVTLSVVGHFPSGTDDMATEIERRIGIFKGYVADNFRRQLKAKYAGAWGKRG